MRPRLLAPLLLLLSGAALGGTSGGTPDHAAAVARPGPVGEEAGPFRERLHRVPVPEEAGGPAPPLIEMRLCRPSGGAGAAPLALINHGSPPSASVRPGMRPAPCDAEAVRWFLDRGYAVALPLRRGYGASGGAWAEGFGRCESPDFGAAGRETARDIAAALAYARGLPGVRSDLGALVVGHSAGGWGGVALAGQAPREVAAVVNLAGGRGGWAGGMPSANCRSDLLVAEAARLGAAAARGAPPMLWVYAANDSFFGPRLAAALHGAFTAAGGAATLVALPAFGRDGHGLFFGSGGSAVWGPVLARWLAPRGLPAEDGPASAAAGIGVGAR